MIEIKGDLFRQVADVICITTNGYVKADGSNVMGMGCAKKAAEINKRVPYLLGAALRKNGNVVNHIIDGKRLKLYSFPVKPKTVVNDGTNVVSHMRDKLSIGQHIGGWASLAHLDIILKSAKELVILADMHGWSKVVIPRPGCGAGELNWLDVKPELDKILDDRFYSITFK